jgi:glutaminase
MSMAVADTPYQTVLDKAYQLYKPDNQGQDANYIPALAAYNPSLFGIVIVTVDGKVYQVGDVNNLFPIESISKIFTLALVLQQSGEQAILDKLDANATGMPFNSVLAVELQPGHIGNPFVNAGAMASVSLVKGKSTSDKWNNIIGMMNAFAGRDLEVNQQVYQSESATNQHNQAIAKLLQSYSRFYSNPAEAVDLYTKQCSINVSAYDLAVMGSVLANHGKSPLTGKQIIQADYVPKILAVMATAGLYDDSGNWLYRVGIPAKSGVGGGIVAVVPGKFAIAAYSPRLDVEGNSVRDQEAIAYIAKQLNANIFN